jgi:hypothetical protein
MKFPTGRMQRPRKYDRDRFGRRQRASVTGVDKNPMVLRLRTQVSLSPASMRRYGERETSVGTNCGEVVYSVVMVYGAGLRDRRRQVRRGENDRLITPGARASRLSP